MISFLACITILGAGEPTLTEVTDADAVAWAHIPELSQSLNALNRSAFKPFLLLFFNEAAGQAVSKLTTSELLAAVWRGAIPGEYQLSLGIDAGSACPEIVKNLEAWLKHQGGHVVATQPFADKVDKSLGSEKDGFGLFLGEQRCGFTKPSGLVLESMRPAKSPLKVAESFRNLVNRTPTALGRARIDVQRFYGWLARTENGPHWARRVRRLGLDGIQSVDLSIRQDGNKTLALQADIAAHATSDGLLAVFGPPQTVDWPKEIPGTAVSFVRVSVKPASLWLLLFKVLSLERPVEAALLNAQLGAAEAKVGYDLAAHAFGDDPRNLTLYAIREANGELTRVVWAEVANPGEVFTILLELAQGLAEVFPELHVSQGSVGKIPSLDVAINSGHWGVRLAVTDAAVVVSTNTAALTVALRSSSKGRRLPQPVKQAVAFGFHDDQEIALLALSNQNQSALSLTHWERVWGDVLRRVGITRLSAKTAIKDTIWTLQNDPQDLHLEVMTRAP